MALVCAAAFALLFSLFAAAVHDGQAVEHDALHCAVCFHAGQTEKSGGPAFDLPFAEKPAAAKVIANPLALPARIVLTARARAPPR